MKTILRHRPEPTPEQQAALDLYKQAMESDQEAPTTLATGDEANVKAERGGKPYYNTTHEKTVAAFGGEATLHYKTPNSEPRTRAWYWTRAQASHTAASRLRKKAFESLRSAPVEALCLLGTAFGYRMQALRFKLVGCFLPKHL